MAPTPRSEEGFTVIEILIALTVMSIGVLGVMAVQGAAVRGNQDGQRLTRAKLLAEQTMEDLRGREIAVIEALPTGALPDVVTPEGVTYRRAFTLATVTGNLVMVTVDVTYLHDDDETDVRGSRLQMLRTRQEKL